MSCEKIISKGRSGTNSNEFTAVVYALLNFFDIDGPESFIATKWYEITEVICVNIVFLKGYIQQNRCSKNRLSPKT